LRKKALGNKSQLPPIKGIKGHHESFSSREESKVNNSQLSRVSSKPKMKPNLPEYDSPLKMDKNREFLVNEIQKN
jgi:hypothetical protein